MKTSLTLIFIASFAASGLCNLQLGLTNPLLGGAVGRPLQPHECLLDCPLGTRCSLVFGIPQCVSITALGGLDGHLGGLDQYRNPIGLSSSLIGKAGFFGFGKCTPMVPACRATRFDRFERCRFTFDPRQQRCVKVYVRNICSRLSGPRSNLFFSIVDCERSCLGRLSY